MLAWLQKNWAKATPFLAIYTTLILCLYVLPQDLQLFLLWVQTPTLWLHQYEEQIFPGGYTRYFNRTVLGWSNKKWPLDRSGVFWSNAPLSFVFFPLSAVIAGGVRGASGPVYAIWTAYFCIFSGFVKLCMFVYFGKYVPGLITGLLVNVPIGVFTVWTYFEREDLPPHMHLIGIEIAFAIQAGLMVYWFKFLHGYVLEKKALQLQARNLRIAYISDV